MMDSQFTQRQYRPSQLEHMYGPNVHILSADPFTMLRLARFCTHGVAQPEVNDLLEALYRDLTHQVIATEFPQVAMTVDTRLIVYTELGVWSGSVVDRTQKVVVVNLPRAGLHPSDIVFDRLVRDLDPKKVRLDIISSERQTNENGQVIGAELSGIKIGGNIDGAMLLFPDPMGATGNTAVKSLDLYRQSNVGTPAKAIALHLIITPEYIRRVTTSCPELIVYALRLDRGLSDPEILKTVPGTHWDQERGLNDHHYIVPGAGGIGEVYSNAEH